MVNVERIIEALQTFQGGSTILYGVGETVTFQDVIDCIKELQSENDRLNDIEFTQEHCDLYKENEWLKDMLRQYMNGEIVNENVFCRSVEEMGEALKYRTKEIYEEAKRLYDNDSNYEGWFSDSSFGRHFKYFIESKGVEVE